MSVIVSHVNKSFGEKTVLRDFSAEFPAGEATCLMGQSGCGKTTLLRLVLGLETAGGGSITGVPDRISAVFQEDLLCMDFSAVSNIRLTAAKSVTDVEIRAHLARLGLSACADAPVQSLSGGMRRRVAIIRAMLHGGALVVLDEPFKGLDEATKMQTMDYVADCCKGKTTIFVTHDAAEAEYFGGRVLYMEGAANEN